MFWLRIWWKHDFLFACGRLNLPLAMLHNWVTAYLYVPQIVTSAGHIVIYGHLVSIAHIDVGRTKRTFTLKIF